MRLLVCGGRNFRERAYLEGTLADVHIGHPISCLIHGDAVGADRFAGAWAERCGIPVAKFPADWDTHGKAAGPIRNGKMLNEGKPDRVLAFPGGPGTADMVRRAKAAGIKVVEMP